MDYRNKAVLVKAVPDDSAEEHDEPIKARGCVGRVGKARSIYEDGRECHDECYLVEVKLVDQLTDEEEKFILNSFASELQLVEELTDIQVVHTLNELAKIGDNAGFALVAQTLDIETGDETAPHNQVWWHHNAFGSPWKGEQGESGAPLELERQLVEALARRRANRPRP